jgi:hypothetical protein
MAKTYMMENDTLFSVVIDDSTGVDVKTFYAPDGTALPADFEGPYGAGWWSWRKITEADWKEIPERERNLRIWAAKADPETEDDPEHDGDPDDSTKPG